MKNKDLKKRIIDLSYKHGLSHLSSVLTAVDIIADIYKIKKPDEKFILSQGQAALALYVVIEKYGGRNAEEITKHHGTHPDRCDDCGLSCSTGSLGHGLPISVGMALADKNRNVYCLISDAECAEGSIWEALEIAHNQNLNNLQIYVNINGYSAYDPIDTNRLVRKLNQWYPRGSDKYITNKYEFPFLKGLNAHYKAMDQTDYEEALEILK